MVLVSLLLLLHKFHKLSYEVPIVEFEQLTFAWQGSVSDLLFKIHIRDIGRTSKHYETLANLPSLVLDKDQFCPYISYIANCISLLLQIAADFTRNRGWNYISKFITETV